MNDGPGDVYRIDTADPVSRFIRDRLRWDWPEFLIAAFVVYGPIEKLLIPQLGGYLVLKGPVRTWVPDVEALLTGFVEFPFFFAYYLWTGRGIGQLFKRLGSTGVVPNAASYQAFWSRARSHFNQPIWTTISAVLALAMMVLWQFVIFAPDSPARPWFAQGEYSNPVHRGLSIVMIGCVAYALGQILIREILALVWLRRFWRELGSTVRVHPYHADNAGGLGAIGRHALHLSGFLMMMLLFIVMGSILPSLRTAGEIAISFWSPWLTVGWIVYLLVLATSLGSLFLPAHEHLCGLRNAKLESISRRLDELLEQQERALDSGGEGLESVLKAMKHVTEVRSQVIEDFPVWPVSRELRVKIGITSLFPAVNFLLSYAFNLLVKSFK